MSYLGDGTQVPTYMPKHSLEVILFLVCLRFHCDLSYEVRCGIFHLWHCADTQKDFDECWWLAPVILTPWEAEIERIVV
jgi:hypothetical protein